jgi:predicted metal-dependent hydrolase
VLINYNDIVVKVEKKAIRHAYLRVQPDGSIVMTVNQNLSHAQIDCIIQQNLAKLKPKITAIQEQRHAQLETKNTAYYLGNKYLVVIFYNQAKKEIAILNNQIMIKVIGSESLSTIQIEDILNNWYKKEAIKVFQSRFIHWLNKIHDWGVLEPSLAIRAMKARFGSYAKHQHKVTLNLWLIKAPIELLDYVIAHELSHIKHFNHSKHFYAELAKLYPSYQQCRQELNQIAKNYCNSHSFL